MNFPKNDFSSVQQPLKILLEGNEVTWKSFWDVVGELKPKHFTYKHPNIEHRTISAMVNHALDAHYSFFTLSLLHEKKYKPLKLVSPKNSSQAQKNIATVYKKIVKDWMKLTDKQLKKKYKTDWGAVLKGDMVIFEAINHAYYHLSEICFVRGLGGFPTKLMG